METTLSPTKTDKDNFVILFDPFPNSLKIRQWSYYTSDYHYILRAMECDDETSGIEWRLEAVEPSYVFISVTGWWAWASAFGGQFCKCIQTFLLRHASKKALAGVNGLCRPYIPCTVRETEGWACVITACSVVTLVISCSASSWSKTFNTCRNGPWLCMVLSSVTRQHRNLHLSIATTRCCQFATGINGRR